MIYFDEELTTPTDAITEIEFSDSTDQNLYTVEVVTDRPLTSAELSTVYLLEIRNLLLILLLVYFGFNFYSKIKNTISTYFGRFGGN